jgi:DNA-directed RNA polymerase specialized sigma subunit
MTETTNKKRLTDIEIDELVEKYIFLKQKAKTNIKEKNEFLVFEKEFVFHMNHIIDLYTYKYKRFSNYEDIRQESFESLMLAVDSFKKSKGKFVGWVKMYSKTKASRQANKHSTIKIPMKNAKDTPPIKVAMEDLPVEDLMRSSSAKDSPEQTAIKNDLWSKVHKSFHKLSEKELKIIQYHFSVDNGEYANIAELCSSLSLSTLDYKRYLKNAAKKVEVDLNLNKSELSNLI